MKILLTGGAGFIGSHLCEAFLRKRHSVVVVDNLSHPIDDSKKILRKVKFYPIDIKNFFLLKKIFDKEKPQIVNHHAAESNVFSSGVSVFQNNVLGTLNLLKLSKESKIKKFIFASSAAVYGRANSFPIREDAELEPISEYGVSKLTAEFFLKLYGNYFQTIIFRYSNVYGPRQNSSTEGGVVSIFSKKMLTGKNCLIYGDGKQTRDLIFVDDVIEANLKVLNFKKSGIFNISSGRQTSILGLFEILKKITEKKIVFGFVPERAGEIRKSILDNSKVKKTLTWQPRFGLEEGLRLTVESIK